MHNFIRCLDVTCNEKNRDFFNFNQLIHLGDLLFLSFILFYFYYVNKKLNIERVV